MESLIKQVADHSPLDELQQHFMSDVFRFMGSESSGIDGYDNLEKFIKNHEPPLSAHAREAMLQNLESRAQRDQKASNVYTDEILVVASRTDTARTKENRAFLETLMLSPAGAVQVDFNNKVVQGHVRACAPGRMVSATDLAALKAGRVPFSSDGIVVTLGVSREFLDERKKDAKNQNSYVQMLKLTESGGILSKAEEIGLKANHPDFYALLGDKLRPISENEHGLLGDFKTFSLTAEVNSADRRGKVPGGFFYKYGDGTTKIVITDLQTFKDGLPSKIKEFFSSRGLLIMENEFNLTNAMHVLAELPGDEAKLNTVPFQFNGIPCRLAKDNDAFIILANPNATPEEREMLARYGIREIRYDDHRGLPFVIDLRPVEGWGDWLSRNLQDNPVGRRVQTASKFIGRHTTAAQRSVMSGVAASGAVAGLAIATGGVSLIPTGLYAASRLAGSAAEKTAQYTGFQQAHVNEEMANLARDLSAE